MCNKTLVIAVIVICFYHSEVYSFWLNTHERITDVSIDSANLNSVVKDQTGLDSPLDLSVSGMKLKKWIIFGSREEDNTLGIPPFRYLNHFYNPLSDSAGLADIPYYGLSSYEWASINDWGWKTARSNYYWALAANSDNARKESLANTFRALGQVMHLIEDLAVPAHVRNDGHPDGDVFERYVNKHLNTLNFYYYVPFANALNSKSAYAPKQFWDSGKYAETKIPADNNTQGLAEYTNANFFSKDTIFKYFPYPAKNEMTIGPVQVIAEDGKVDLRKYLYRTNDPNKTKLAAESYIANHKYILDEAIHNDYASLLIPRAVGYSAGLLNYFFRGKIDMVKDPNTPGQYILKNNSGEDMNGVFALYYDDLYGNRYPVEGASWSLFISANGQSSAVRFTPPNTQSMNYILVFQGALGNEKGAVVGREVKLEEIKARVVTVYKRSSDYNYPWYGNITVLTKSGVITGKLPLTGYYQINAVRFDVKDKNSFVILTLNYDYTAKKSYYNFHKYSIDESTLTLTYQGVALNQELYSEQETKTQIYEEDVSEYYEDYGVGSVFYKMFNIQGTAKRTDYSDFFLEDGNVKPFGLITETSYSRTAGGLYTGDGTYIDGDNGNHYYFTYIQNQQLYYGGAVVETTPYNCTGGYYDDYEGEVRCQPYAGTSVVQTGNSLGPVAIFNSLDYAYRLVKPDGSLEARSTLSLDLSYLNKWSYGLRTMLREDGKYSFYEVSTASNDPSLKSYSSEFGTMNCEKFLLSDKSAGGGCLGWHTHGGYDTQEAYGEIVNFKNCSDWQYVSGTPGRSDVVFDINFY